MRESRLKTFLKSAANSHSREAMLRHLLTYDLRRAAACAGYDLHVYAPEVDHEGFDLVLDDGEETTRVQLKSTVASRTQSWDIKKGHFRSAMETCEQLGFPADLAGRGHQGGIVLIDAEVRDCELEVVYFYADVLVFAAMYHRVIVKTSGPTASTLGTLWKALLDGPNRETVKVSRSMFLRARSAETLLALMGLRSRYGGNWRWRLLDVTRPRWSATASGLDRLCCARIVHEELQNLTEDALTLEFRPSEIEGAGNLGD